MILLIDNYDSFSYNLYQLIGSVNPDIQVVRNDEISLGEIEKLAPEAIVLSPGPGRPEEAGICIPVIKEFAGKIPILGVCLGHQSICEAFGGVVSYAKELKHGKRDEMIQCGSNVLFNGLPEKFPEVFQTSGSFQLYVFLSAFHASALLHRILSLRRLHRWTDVQDRYPGSAACL